MLLSFAEAGANVVRLKGGDPLVSTLHGIILFTISWSCWKSGANYYNFRLQVFGRGGEEMDFLQQQGIEVKVIPGMVNFQRIFLSWVHLHLCYCVCFLISSGKAVLY